MISFMCECFIFLYLGLGLLSFGDQATYDVLYILAACLSILISRTHVFIVLSTSNLIQKQDAIPWSHQVLIWFSGLRGAVAFALGVTFLELPNFTKQVKGIIFGTTVMVVVLTVLILGGLTPYMIKWLGISGNGNESATKKAEDEDDDYALSARVVNKPFFGWLYKMDATYIRPHFTDISKDKIAQIIRKLSQTGKSEGEFILLKEVAIPDHPNNASQEKSFDTAKTVKVSDSEEVMLEAVSLN